MKFDLRNFRWHYWLLVLLVTQGGCSFIGVLLYSYGHKYHNVVLENYGMLFWVMPALPLYFYLIPYAIKFLPVGIAHVKAWWLHE